jgi:hypothetical protein
MSSDAVVERIPNRIPEPGCPGVIFLDQSSDALRSLDGEPLFDLGYQGTGKSSPPIDGVNRQTIKVASPTVKCPDDRANQPPINLDNNDAGPAVSHRSPKIVGAIRDAWRGFRLPPEFKEAMHLFRATVPDGQVTHPDFLLSLLPY